MSKTKKHRFTHQDPESVPQADIRSNQKNVSAEEVVNPETKNIKKDLRRVIGTILVSVILLVVFYFVNQRYDLLKEFGQLLSL